MNKEDIKNVQKGDIVQLFGTKVKLIIMEDQTIGSPMVGYNSKNKPIKFALHNISKITRAKKIIYHIMEE